MNSKIRRAMALGAVIVIAGLWILTFIFAVTGREKTTDLTMLSLVASVVVPCLLYVFLRISARLGGTGEAGEDGKGMREDKKE